MLISVKNTFIPTFIFLLHDHRTPHLQQEQLDEKDEKLKTYMVQIEALRGMAKEQQAQFDTEKAAIKALYENEVTQMKEQTAKLETLLNKCRETLK
jgi:predicted transcriptional regulator YheO